MHNRRALIIGLIAAIFLAISPRYDRGKALGSVMAQATPTSQPGLGCNQYSATGFSPGLAAPAGGTFKGSYLFCGWNTVSIDTQSIYGVACNLFALYRVSDPGLQPINADPFNAAQCVDGKLVINAVNFPAGEYRLYTFTAPPTVPQGDVLLNNKP